jgi:hypothetical protein
MPYLSLTPMAGTFTPLRLTHPVSFAVVLVAILVLVDVAQNDVISLLFLCPCVPLFLASAGIRAVSPPTADFAYVAFGTNTCKVELRYNVVLSYDGTLVAALLDCRTCTN